MSIVLYVIIALLVLTVFVFVHELGHYGVGRLFKFEIDEFALGMGPVILKKKSRKNGILYALRALPIGGMCRFYGEDEDTDDAPSARVGFNRQKVGKRALVVAAGPVMNLIFAYIIAVIILASFGDFVPAVNSFTAEDSPAAVAGMQPGDIITHVDGKRLIYYNQLTTLLQKADSSAAEITVERDGEPVTLVCRDIYNEQEGRNYIGIYIDAVRKSFGLFEALGFALQYVWGLILEMFGFFGRLFQRGGVTWNDVGGPATIIEFITLAVRSSFEDVLRLAVIISVNLGFINLLPLPALDGGRLVFMGVEAIRGKPAPAKVEGMVHFVGLILLFGLIILLTVKDFIRIFGG